MKNLRLLFLTIPFILFACSDDDEGNGDTPNALLGKWEAFGNKVEVDTNNDEAKKAIQAYFGFEKGDEFTIEFFSDGKLTMSETYEGEEYKEDVKYEVKGKELIVLYDGERLSSEFWIEGSTLYTKENATEEVKEELPYIVENPEGIKINSASVTTMFKRIK
ncbi:MAG: hypothetical protein GX963_10055 [Bacteroidales bacterium]|mgnify:CR=1 FL=1|nr:hypothetical protein [Bacteroidales bacterium]